MRAALPSLALLLAACAGDNTSAPQSAETEAGLAKALAGRVAGAPTSCIPIGYPSMSTKTFGRTLLYQQPGGTIYRNDTTGGCEGGARGDALIQVEHEGRPCSGDIIRTVDFTSHITTGSCALGPFTPYERPRHQP